MFTVKHTRQGYTEALYTCREVTYQPVGGGWPHQPSPDAPEAVYLSGGDSGIVTLERGTVYVMNDSGATVSKYDLELARQQTSAPVAA